MTDSETQPVKAVNPDADTKPNLRAVKLHDRRYLISHPLLQDIKRHLDKHSSVEWEGGQRRGGNWATVLLRRLQEEMGQ